MSRLVVSLQSFVAPVRRARGLTQQQLARAAGVSRQTIVELEAGGYNPSTALALRLALLLDVAVEELFALTDEETAALLQTAREQIPIPKEEADAVTRAVEPDGADGRCRAG